MLEEALKMNPEESDCFFDVFEEDSIDWEVMDLINKYRKES